MTRHIPAILHLAHTLKELPEGSPRRRMLLDLAAQSGFDIPTLYRAAHVIEETARAGTDVEFMIMRQYAIAGWVEGWLDILGEVPPLSELSVMYRHHHRLP